jgi:hypothetical protein
MTQLNAPGTKAGTTFPLAVNASQNVVGYGTATAGGTVGFLYEGGKYTSIKYPGSTISPGPSASTTQTRSWATG